MSGLVDSGFEVIDGVVPPPLLEALRHEVVRLVANEPAERLAAHRSLGSLIDVARSALFAELVALPGMLARFAAWGFPHPRFTGGYVFDKPPGSGPTFWHQDWYFWDDPVSARSTPAQVGLLYYLSDTSVSTGCLRLLPTARRARHPLHDLLLQSDKRALRRGDGPPALFASADGELPVPVMAGSAVALDARVLHSAYANLGAVSRPLVTLWYVADEAALSEPTRAAFGSPALPEGWPRERVEPLLMRYAGTATPAATTERGPS